MVSELFRQIRYFKFPFGFPEIFFAQSIVISVCRSLSHQDFAMRYLFWQIGDVNLFSPAENETALERMRLAAVPLGRQCRYGTRCPDLPHWSRDID